MTLQPDDGSGRETREAPAASRGEPSTDVPARLRLLHVTPRFLPHVGGTEIHTYEVTRRLAAAGHDVTVLTTAEEAAPPREEVHGVRIIRVRAWPSGRDYYLAPAILRLIVSGSWDLVHCQSYHTLVAPLAMAAARLSHKPYVVTFHSGGHSSRVRRSLRHVQMLALQPLLVRAAALIAVSRFESDHFARQLNISTKRISLIPNGSFLTDTFDGATSEIDPWLIVSVGRLERYKGHHRVIAALPILAEWFPHIQLRILGSGPYETSLRKLASDIGVADRVYIGSVPGADRHSMAAAIGQAALVVLLSDYESQGLAAMEAIALGRPVLVAETSALQDLVKSGLATAANLGASPYDVARAIAEQIKKPLVPPPINLPSWDACADRILALYRTVLMGRPCISS